MAKFYKFRTAVLPMNSLKMEEELGIKIEARFEYEELAVRLDSIIFYYPSLRVNLHDLEDDALYEKDEAWFEAQFINVVLMDGSEIIIHHDIQDFEKLLEEND